MPKVLRKKTKPKKKSKPEPIRAFDFKPGRTLARKYEVVSKLGQGYEAEVYLLREHATGIERAAKFFFPHRNPRNKSINFYAKKLHKLRGCPALIQYHTQEVIQHKGQDISFLISDYVEGEILLEFLKQQPGKKLDAFQGLHLLHALVCAVEDIHRRSDYHGDLHPGNVIIRRQGLGFHIKLLDFFHWGSFGTQTNIKDEIVDVIRIFYDAIGGKERYAKQPDAVKNIVLGLKRSLILKKFKSTSSLRDYLENMDWHDLR